LNTAAREKEQIMVSDMAGPVRMFLGGGWAAAASGATSMAMSPATGESLGPVPEGDREDARRALDAAAVAFPSWSAATPFDRARLLHRIGEVCDRRRDELASTLTLDQGKPLRAEAYEEVEELIAFWHLAAEDAVRLEGVIPPSSFADKRVLVMRRARGPIGVITPWNWPYTMPAELIAPALACGNTVVWTPAPSTAVCSALLAECVAEADLPAGVASCAPARAARRARGSWSTGTSARSSPRSWPRRWPNGSSSAIRSTPPRPWARSTTKPPRPRWMST
jgi:succinate-semialdehyde dehydrogenase/glutarate-semialdehyde dehydrogenase